MGHSGNHSHVGSAEQERAIALKRTCCEVTVALVIVLGYCWIARTWDRPLRAAYVSTGLLVALYLVVTPVGGRRLGWADWGFGTKGMLALSVALLLPVAVATFACAAISPDPEETVPALVVRATSYLPWALLQDLFVLGLLRSRFLQILGSKAATTWATGIAFGLLHMPNPALMATTSVLGLVFAWSFSSRPCILVIAAAHALLGAAADDILDWNLRVGIRYCLGSA